MELTANSPAGLPSASNICARMPAPLLSPARSVHTATNPPPLRAASVGVSWSPSTVAESRNSVLATLPSKSKMRARTARPSLSPPLPLASVHATTKRPSASAAMAGMN
jgi:hypothetical protein